MQIPKDTICIVFIHSIGGVTMSVDDKPIHIKLEITMKDDPELYEFLKKHDIPLKWFAMTAMYRYKNESKYIMSRDTVRVSNDENKVITEATDTSQPSPMKKFNKF